MAHGSTDKYILVRGTSPIQRLWYLYHRLGIWSNILVAARYTSSKGEAPTKVEIFDALRRVLAAQPALWQVFVQRPSATKGRRDLHTAVLRTIDLEKCVEYLNDDDNEDVETETGITSDVLERIHNEWLWTSDEPERPLWKLVVKGRNIAFVTHHSVADGMSGMVFHRELLAALNSSSAKSDGSTLVHANEQATDLALIPKHPEEVWDGKDSLWESLWLHLIFLFLRLFYGKWRLFSDLPPSKPHLASTTTVAEPSQRTVTGISSRRISADDMANILGACRRNQTTFTPLLITTLLIVLSSEFYPQAKVGASRYNFDIRNVVPMARVGSFSENGVMLNASGSWQSLHRLAAFQRVVQGKKLQSDGVWELVRTYKHDMTDAIHGKAMRMWIGLKNLGTDLESMVRIVFPSVGFLLRPTFSVSNIGAFRNNVPDGLAGKGTWQIDDMQLSAGAVNGNQGSHGIVFHVAGVNGGATRINATYEKGIVPKDLADSILERTVARMLEVS